MQAEVCVLVGTPEQARVALKAGANRLYRCACRASCEDLLAKVTPWLDEVCRGLTISAWIPTLLEVSRLLWVISPELALTVERGAILGARVYSSPNDYALSGACHWVQKVSGSTRAYPQEICHLARNASTPGLWSAAVFVPRLSCIFDVCGQVYPRL